MIVICANDVRGLNVQPIAILCHWHTGSSCLSKTLAACGMEVGNEKTYWAKECEAQCEHSELNRIGDNISRGIVLQEEIDRIGIILRSYVEQAKEEGWKHFGVKFTHVLQKECWKYFGPAFEKYWPGVKYVVAVRDPEVFVKTTKDSSWPEERIMCSWASTLGATLFLAEQGAHIVVYPDSFETNRVASVVRALGLEYGEKAKTIFNPAKNHAHFKPGGAPDFYESYPDEMAVFRKLKNMADRFEGI